MVGSGTGEAVQPLALVVRCEHGVFLCVICTPGYTYHTNENPMLPEVLESIMENWVAAVQAEVEAMNGGWVSLADWLEVMMSPRLPAGTWTSTGSIWHAWHFKQTCGGGHG